MPDTLAARSELAVELARLRAHPRMYVDDADSPVLCQLLAHAENAARKGAGGWFHFRGSRYRFETTSLGRVVVRDADGRHLISSEPGSLMGTCALPPLRD